LAYFLVIVFPYWAYETTVFHMVGLLTLCPTPNLEDWDCTLGFAFLVALPPCLRSPPLLFVVAPASFGFSVEANPALVTLLLVTLPCRKSPSLFEA